VRSGWWVVGSEEEDRSQKKRIQKGEGTGEKGEEKRPPTAFGGEV